MGILKSINSNILYFMQNHVQNSYLTPIMVQITDSVYVWMIICIIFLFLKKIRRVGILTISSILLTTVLGEVIKNIVKEPRPFETFKGFHLLIQAPTSYSFPSLSTAIAFASAIMIAYYIRKSIIPVITLAILTGFSRIYFTVHYPTDVLAGMLLGLFCSLAVIYINKKIENKNAKNKNIYV